MDWIYLAWGYGLIGNVIFTKGENVLTDVIRSLMFSVGATIVTVQILIRLGV